MNEVVREISLDLSRKSNTGIVFSSQSDMNSRTLLISLFDDGVPYPVSRQVTAALNICRSDGSSGSVIAMVTADGKVRYTAGSWMLEISGETKISVSLYDGDSKLTSSPFTLNVAPGLYLGDDINSDVGAMSTFESIMGELAAERAELISAIEHSESASANVREAVAAAESSSEAALTSADEARSAAQAASAAAKLVEDTLSGISQDVENAAMSASRAAKSEQNTSLYLAYADDKADAAARSAADAAQSAERLDIAMQNGYCPILSRSSGAEAVIEANTVTELTELTEDCTVTLAEAAEGSFNEWIFTVTQGETAYNVSLPEVSWQLGIAPAFAPNSVTEVRLYRIGNTLRGVWNT